MLDLARWGPRETPFIIRSCLRQPNSTKATFVRHVSLACTIKLSTARYLQRLARTEDPEYPQHTETGVQCVRVGEGVVLGEFSLENTYLGSLHVGILSSSRWNLAWDRTIRREIVLHDICVDILRHVQEAQTNLRALQQTVLKDSQRWCNGVYNSLKV